MTVGMWFEPRPKVKGIWVVVWVRGLLGAVCGMWVVWVRGSHTRAPSCPVEPVSPLVSVVISNLDQKPKGMGYS